MADEDATTVAAISKIAERNGWRLDPSVEVPWQSALIRHGALRVVARYLGYPGHPTIAHFDILVGANAVRLTLDRTTQIPYVLTADRALVIAQESRPGSLLLWVTVGDDHLDVSNLIGAFIPILGRKLAVQSMKASRSTLIVRVLHVMSHGSPDIVRTYRIPLGDIEAWAAKSTNHTTVRPGDDFVTEDLNTY